MKIKKIIEFQYDNHENQNKNKISFSCAKYENHENHKISYVNDENHENH